MDVTPSVSTGFTSPVDNFHGELHDGGCSSTWQFVKEMHHATGQLLIRALEQET